ncbi:MAG: tRNA-specific 2-thiouridylase [Parcubacteria group bacterium Gr01-1014_48]|nr:MAG: tRNA-specific 2-thiouridylase [Parcubacteria group bacterium Gr01-1014_48]
MSGGVDSSVAALLLGRAGYDVHGVYMKEWIPRGVACSAGDDRLMAARVAAHLKIPFSVWDVADEYRRLVADYMLKEYRAGRTPNPDVMCNSRIKFGVFLKRALKEGADFVATGHYIKMQNVKIKNQNDNTKYKISKATDKNKDQSYFLWALTQKQLSHSLFPIGYYIKSQVRAIAKKAGLPSWDKKDSQGICFVGKLDFSDFLRAYLPCKKGKIITTDGREIGMHDGAWFYTIGQRHGLTRITNYESRIMDKKGNIQPYYVVHKNIKSNVLIVAEKLAAELYAKELVATDVNWVSGIEPKFPLRCLARIRYRQPLQLCHIFGHRASEIKVVFSKPQRAVTPGQSVVFYKKDGEMLGGGVIA